MLTRYSKRSILGQEVAGLARQIAQRLNTKVFDTTIREAIAIKEAQISQQSLFSYAPKAPVTDDYRAFIEEVIGKGE